MGSKGSAAIYSDDERVVLYCGRFMEAGNIFIDRDVTEI